MEDIKGEPWHREWVVLQRWVVFHAFQSSKLPEVKLTPGKEKEIVSACNNFLQQSVEDLGAGLFSIRNTDDLAEWVLLVDESNCKGMA